MLREPLQRRTSTSQAMKTEVLARSSKISTRPVLIYFVLYLPLLLSIAFLRLTYLMTLYNS